MTRNVQTNFTAGGGFGRQKAAPAPKAESPAVSKEGEFSGTVDEILAVVGDDKELTKKALDAENAKDRPRKTLLEELEARLADEDADDAEAGEEA